MTIARDGSEEFVCVERGTPVVRFVPAETAQQCFTCLWLPGWYEDPVLRAKLGPNLPPLVEGVQNGN